MTKAEGSADLVASARSNTVAVVTAFNPDRSLAAAVDSALLQCARVVVVDNTPAGGRLASEVLEDRNGLTILHSGSNVGLAAALRRGIDASGESPYIFFLDQDSVVAAGLVAALAALLEEDDRRAIASPAPWDARAGRFLDPRTASRPDVAEMRVVITSAMLLRRAAYRQTNGMREDFFVDCVDQDLCLQLRKAGWTIVQDKRLLLPHSLGSTQWHGVGPLKLRATHHPRWRLYWAARNGVILSRENLRFDPRWSITNAALLAYWLLTVALFEPPRWPGIRALLHGIGDGIRSRRDLRYLPGSGA